VAAFILFSVSLILYNFKIAAGGIHQLLQQEKNLIMVVHIIGFIAILLQGHGTNQQLNSASAI